MLVIYRGAGFLIVLLGALGAVFAGLISGSIGIGLLAAAGIMIYLGRRHAIQGKNLFASMWDVTPSVYFVPNWIWGCVLCLIAFPVGIIEFIASGQQAGGKQPPAVASDDDDPDQHVARPPIPPVWVPPPRAPGEMFEPRPPVRSPRPDADNPPQAAPRDSEREMPAVAISDSPASSVESEPPTRSPSPRPRARNSSDPESVEQALAWLRGDDPNQWKRSYRYLRSSKIRHTDPAVAREILQIQAEASRLDDYELRQLVGYWGSEASIPDIAEYINSKPVEERTYPVLGMLEEWKTPAAAAALEQQIHAGSSPDSPEQKQLTARALTGLQSIGTASEDVLQRLLLHPDPDVQRRACSMAPYCGTAALVPTLRRVAESSSDGASRTLAQSSANILAKRASGP